MDEREKNLPKWAQELIRDLRLRVQISTEHLTREVVKLRPQVDELKAANGALRELLACAGRGGHMTAQEIIGVIDDYSLTLTKEES